MADGGDWSSDANDAFKISIIQPGPETLKTLSTFHPTFTYPIFGDEERIFGYKNLNIHLRFAAHDLYPNVHVSYDEKFKPVGDTKADELLKILKDWMPSYAFSKLSSFKTHLQEDQDASSFHPPGEHIDSYHSRGRSFEIWRAELTDPAVQLLLERMQILISLFIEAGTPLELHDQEWTLARWRVFFVYEKLPQRPTPTGSIYSIVGYSTSYRFLTYQPSSKSPQPISKTFEPSPISVASLPCRARISQFLILAPHQKHSHGEHLYNAMISTFIADPAVLEITVEDPSEAFDDLRDYCDYAKLYENGDLASLKFHTDIDPRMTSRGSGVKVPSSKLLDKKHLDSIRLKNKLAPRQFSRLLEMYLLSNIPYHVRESGTVRLTQRGKASSLDDRAYYYWRLLVKQRIYKKNKDVLIHLERAEKIDKVEETLGQQQGDYERLLKGIEERRQRVEDDRLNGEVEGMSSTSSAERRAKRKVVDLESEDEDQDVGGGVRLNGSGASDMGGAEDRGAKRRKEGEGVGPGVTDITSD
ncbi:MAG: histone acetyltransferase 1 [Icmadophila ericetorum]|nr:histone acetyltransferase 1 [Icmadophila ericetorum]